MLLKEFNERTDQFKGSFAMMNDGKVVLTFGDLRESKEICWEVGRMEVVERENAFPRVAKRDFKLTLT